MIAAMDTIGRAFVAAVRATGPMREVPLEWPLIGFRIEGPDTPIGRALVGRRYAIHSKLLEERFTPGQG